MDRGLIGKIHNCDCLDFMKQLPDKCVDLCLTDPPYGILGGTKTIGGTNIVEATIYPEMTWDYNPISPETLKEVFRISKNQIIFGYNHFSDLLPSTKCFIAWDKACQNGWNDTFADGELAWTSFDKPAKFYRYLWKGALKAQKERRYHPTQKPLTVLKWILQDFSNESDIIFDPFMGSGTTAVASYQMGRKWFGCEISSAYVEIANKRIAEEMNNLFENGDCENG